MNRGNRNHKQAVALLGEPVCLPRMLAKGEDELADRIIAVAREHNIPIKEEPELVKLLSEVALGDDIPDLLFSAVSEVLSFAYMLKSEVEVNPASSFTSQVEMSTKN